MSLLQLVLKGMRQRSLGTWLTILSVMLGVGMATAVLIALRESDKLFVQTEYGYDVVVGAKGSPTQLVLNTVYGIDRSPGNIPYAVYESLANPRHPFAKLAIPIAVGDSYEGLPIVGTTPRMFNADDAGSPLAGPDPPFEYRPGHRYELSAGRWFHGAKFEAVIGAEAVARAKLKVGDRFKVTHGMPKAGEPADVHEQDWEVVGILQRTNTAADRNLYIPLISFWAMSGHDDALIAQMNLRAAAGRQGLGDGLPVTTDHASADAAAEPAEGASDAHAHEPADLMAPAAHGDDDHDDDHDHAYHLNDDGTIHLHLPKESWMVSAVLVRARGDTQRAFPIQSLIYSFNNLPIATAVNPAAVMQEFFKTFLRGSSLVLLAVSVLVTLVAAVGILVSIYNSIAARRKEIAVLRALGASRTRILAMVCGEAAMVGLIGGLLGLVLGHALAAVGSFYAASALGQPLAWWGVGSTEWLYLAGTVLLATLAGLVPALVAYRTPVATHLTAG